MRKFSNGLLKDDAFAYPEALLLPPGVRLLIIMFNRFHNYIAAGLLAYGYSKTVKPFETEANVRVLVSMSTTDSHSPCPRPREMRLFTK